MGRKRYQPYNNPLKPVKPSNSDKVTIVGRRTPLDAGGRTRTLLPAKAKQVTFAKLATMQKRDTAFDELRIQKELTTAQQVDFAAFQDSFAGGSSILPELPASSFDLLHTASNESEDEDYDGSRHADDEAEAMEDFGLEASKSEWSERRDTEHAPWTEMLPALCDAYLAFRSETVPTSTETDSAESFEILCVELDLDTVKVFYLDRETPSANAALLRNAYLGCSPWRPRTAICVRLLDLFANLMRRGPSLSVLVLAKACCDSRNVPFTRSFRTQLTIMLDVFNMIQREVRRRLDRALGREGPYWREKNTCPACTFKLKNEPPLEHSVLVTCDGNDSLKRCINAGTADHRHLESDYYIPPSEVNVYANEVASRKKKKKGEEEESVCEKRWKNAKIHSRADSDKPKAVFRETGIFMSACRHSFILTVCDMIQSGEQAKYALATVMRLMDIFGPDLMMGYDIGCTFGGTMARSPLVGPRAAELGFGTCVGGFHGPAHNRSCQLDNHPLNIRGTGLTDFENCETIFSSTNRMAGTTRLVSAYHRHQRIDNHLSAYDDDMYLTLGYLLRTKYINALAVLNLATSLLAKLRPQASAPDFERFRNEERKYLESLTSELPEETFAIRYVDLLVKLEQKQAEFDRSYATNFHAMDGPASGDLRRTTLLTSRLESRRRATLEQLVTLQDAVAQVEQDHNIAIRWTRQSEDWKKAEELCHRRHFHASLDELERLVVQRLLELSKAGLAGTGYKMRQQILRALIARSTAIKSALTRYNHAAAQLLGANARVLTWEDVSKISCLEEFELLRGSRRGVLDQEWAQPEVRQSTEQWHRVQHAEEEIARLNIEVKRVRTSIAYESSSLPAAVCQIQETDPGLGWAANRYMTRRLKMSAIVLHQLDLLSKLPGYTSSRKIGIRLGSQACAVPLVPISLPPPDHVSEPFASEQPEHSNVNSHAESCTDDDDDMSDLFARWRLVMDVAQEGSGANTSAAAGELNAHVDVDESSAHNT